MKIPLTVREMKSYSSEDLSKLLAHCISRADYSTFALKGPKSNKAKEIHAANKKMWERRVNLIQDELIARFRNA